MNALAPQPTSSTAISEISLSPHLFSLLIEEAGSADAIEAIARSAVLVSEAARALPALQRAATEPAGYEGVKRVVGRRFALFRQPERSEGEWAEFWADYVDTVGHLPEGVIEAAMAAWVRQPDAEWLPKPGKLLELAKTTPNRMIRAYERAKAAMDFKVTSSSARLTPGQVAEMIRPIGQSAPRVEPTQAEKDHVRRMCRQFIAQDDERRAAAAAKAKGSAPIPDTTGPADEKGLTPQMRQLLAKQRQTPKPFEGPYE